MLRTSMICLLLGLGLGSTKLCPAQYNYGSYEHYHQVPPIAATQWKLGVAVNNLEGGCEVTHVTLNSAAARVGIKVGDLILSVNETAVGYSNGRLYDFSDVINARADTYGRVSLKVRDGKFGPWKIIPIRLMPTGSNISAPGNGPQSRPPRPGITTPISGVTGSGNFPAYRPPVASARPETRPQVYQPDEIERRIERWYLDYLGRYPSRQDMAYWTSMVARGTNAHEVQVAILSSSELYDRAGNDAAKFTRMVYQLVVSGNSTAQQLEVWNQRDAWARALVNTYHGDRTRFVRELLRRLGEY